MDSCMVHYILANVAPEDTEHQMKTYFKRGHSETLLQQKQREEKEEEDVSEKTHITVTV